MTGRPAERVVKIRWPLKLNGCGCHVVGGRAYLIPGRGWCCRDCAEIDKLMQQPPRPSERGDTTDERTAP